MKTRRQRKRLEENHSQGHPPKLEQRPVTIKFDLCKDSIACFIGERKSLRKKTGKGSASLKKNKASQPAVQPKKEEAKLAKQAEAKIRQTDSEEIVQGSLNTILTEIESKGVGCVWSEGEEAPDQNAENQTSELWSAFSMGESFEKSPASTMDVRPPMVYYMEDSFGYSSYSYRSYGYRGGEEGSLFLLRLDGIMSDARTTVMVRNIPNKYTIKQLSEQIDGSFSNTYDFLYLPCDIKNQCNVGYGFINFLSTEHLFAFYQVFQDRKWAKFRSEKICNLTYARLQGLHSLIDHFQNSKVLNQKDKKYRPIIRQFGKIQNLIKTQQLT